jgi:Zn-dependent peptidase ImmA (M78 family)/transcriptional regulator with XRE-family HTH domain
MSGLGDVLTIARRSRGLTQAELAESAGLTQAALSRYESGLREPDGDVLDRLGRTLGVTTQFLTQAGRVRGGMAVDEHMRRRLTAKPTVWRRLEARLNEYRLHASLLFEEVSIRADQRVPALDPLDVPAADAARLVRMQWRMPIGPVHTLVRWLEAAGCLVIEEDFGTSRVDGMSQWVGDHPVILLNSAAPTDRKRLTLAHELGHLVLHSQEVTPDLEREADQFAAEFLMPMQVVRAQLRNLKPGRLHDLKREWGVSMQALIERAHEARLLTVADRKRLYSALGIRDWRIHEPVSDELPPETAELAQNVGFALRARGLSGDDIARLAGFASDQDNHLFRPGNRQLRVV